MASGGGNSFRSLTDPTAFPVLHTVVDANFDGDTASTQAGATITVGRSLGDYTLTLNHPTAGIIDANSSSRISGIPLGIWAYGNENLEYTRFGTWQIGDYFSLGGNIADQLNLYSGAWAIGYVTPANAVPTSGVANYQGSTIGLWSTHYASCGCAPVANVTGQVSLTTDFGGRTLSGTLTNLRARDTFPFEGPINDITFNAAFDPSRNLFTGTTRAMEVPAIDSPDVSFFALTLGATGSIAARFYGPNATEIGAVWTLSDAVKRIIGSFGARRQ